jgi:hypothetical protein
MPKAEPHQLTLDLFPEPNMDRELPGFLDVENQIRHLVTRMVMGARKDRYRIAAEMSRDMEKDVTHHMLNSWTSSKEGNRFPLSYLPAFERACGSYQLLEFLAEKRGCSILVGHETDAANLGRIQLARQDLEREEAAIQRRIDQHRRLLEMTQGR